MNESTDILIRIRQIAVKRKLFLPHAIRQMSKPNRMISTTDNCTVIEQGEVIGNYPEDARGHSCLLLGFTDNRFLHVVFAPKDDFLAIITAHLPSAQEWEDNYGKRKKS
jgi:hypothetical protein